MTIPPEIGISHKKDCDEEGQHDSSRPHKRHLVAETAEAVGKKIGMTPDNDFL